MTPLEWRAFYQHERESLGTAGLDALLDAAPEVRAPVVFPHTRLAASGHLVAAAAKSVLAHSRVLALGVLHGAGAMGIPRGVYTRGDAAPDEFSLDNFEALLARAAERAGKKPPEIIARFPCLAGGDPETLPGLDELRALLDAGCALVATADPVHHGVGYRTPEARAREHPDTRAFATELIRAQLDALSSGDFQAFRTVAERARSDFRDVGPVLATVLGRPAFAIEALELVDYADVLGDAGPTWVAAPLVTAAISTRSSTRHLG